MITDAILSLILFVVESFIAILPDAATFPSWVHTAATTGGGYLKGLNGLMNTDFLLSSLSFIVAFEIIVLAWNGVRWIINVIRGSGA